MALPLDCIALHSAHSHTYTKYDKSNACNFKLFGSATVIYSIFNAFRAECNVLKSHKSQSMHNQWKYFKINYKRKLCGVDKRENAVANKFELFSFRYFKFRFLSYPLDIDPIFARFKILFIFSIFFALLCFAFAIFFALFFILPLSLYGGKRHEQPNLLSSSMLQIMAKLQLLRDTKWN